MKNLLFAVGIATALSCSAAMADPIGPAEAKAHVGQTLTVQGVVSEVYVSKKGNDFLNFGGPYPNQDFRAVIFARFAPQFGAVGRYEGKQIRVTGTVKLYQGKPEIILQSPNQLK